MKSESRWEKRNDNNTYWNKDYKKRGYIEDKSLEKEDSWIKKLLIAGAIASGGIAAYKKGVFKKPISKAMKKASAYKGIAPTVTSSIKDWMAFSGKNQIKEVSLVRAKGIKDLAKRLKSNQYEELMRRTTEDFSNLSKIISNNVSVQLSNHKKNIKNNLAKSDLLYNMSTIEYVSNTFLYSKERARASQIMINDFINKFSQNKNNAAKQIERTGYRQATLNDLIEYSQDSTGKMKFFNKVANRKFDDDTLERVSKFIKQTKLYDSKGELVKHKDTAATLLNTEKWKDFVLDKDIFVDAVGDVIDLREINKAKASFVRSLATDFQIPFVGLNPLKMLGFDKYQYKETIFGTLSKNSVQPAITKKTGNVTLKEFLKDTSSSDVLYSDGKAFVFNKKLNDFQLIRDDLALEKIYPNSKQIPKKLNDYSKMANLKTREYKKYTSEDGMIKHLFGSIGDFLDIGSQDSTRLEFVEGSYSNVLKFLDPSTYIEKSFGYVSNKKIFNKGHGDVKKISSVFGQNSSRKLLDDEAPVLVALKKNIKLKEVLDTENSATIKDYFAQFLKGRKDIGEVTPNSLFVYNLFERMNQALSPFGLALSQKSTGDVSSTISNLILKRFLPVYAVAQGMMYLDYLSEDNEGNTLGKGIAKTVAGVDVAFHKVLDASSLTDKFKRLKQLTPGHDHITELPLINKLGLGESAEERAKYYEDGMDPVRKGRYWALGNTAFTGGKIQYYKPNWYREVMADGDFNEVKYGSRKEYFDNAWFPTPTAPFAPVKHFITDKYHYEEKHYKDRPYLLTSPEFEGVPIFGPILSSTLGKIIKPQKRMHEEYWRGEQVSSEAQNNFSRKMIPYNKSFNQNDSILNENNSVKISSPYDNNKEERKVLGNINVTSPLMTGEQLKSLGVISLPNDGKEVYTTASGQQSIVDVDRSQMAKIRKELKDMSIKRIIGSKNRVDMLEENKDEPVLVPYNQLYKDANPNNLINSLTNQYKDSTNVLGIYGYAASAFITGDLGKDKDLIETSGYAYSFRDKFWDKELGGLGGDLSEIFRRFVQKRRTDVNYINPVRNTMPEWLPGEDYFENFKIGDPYNKIAKGEFRLPGDAYEKLWGIKDPLVMEIGSSTVGKSKSDIVNHFLRNSTITDQFSADIVEEGSKIHEDIQKEWLDSGLAIDIEAKVEDKVNNIVGYYDARIHDEFSPNKEAIVDIKSINDRGFREVKENQKAKELHQKQVNFYLWATGAQRGYVYYVNRETNERYTAGFDYDENMLKESIDTVNEARNEVREKIDSGELSVGDLYRPVDRYRILADVAPYSEEFRNMKAILSRTPLREEDKKKVDEINERVIAQKEPNRIYEYKFKTANVDSVKTEITKVDGKSIYVNFQGEERRIIFSGLSKKHGTTRGENRIIEETEADIKKNLVEGASVKLKVDHDSLARDKIKGLKAVVIDDRGTNINKEMLRKNVAVENEKDFSPTAVHARFSASERAFGHIWESIAHFNSYINTKFLQVRSAREDYERNEVYNKNFKTWDKPIEDYLMPALYSAIERPEGLIVGAFVGSLFGASASKTKYGKVVGAILGMSAVLVGKAYKTGYEATTKENWIPEPRRKERNLNEYIDILKFIKNRNLYNKYKDIAMEEDGFDVESYLAGKRNQAKNRTSNIKSLNAEKDKKNEKYLNLRKERDFYLDNLEKPQRERSDIEEVDLKLKKEYERELEEYKRKQEEAKQRTREAKAQVKEVNAKIEEESSFRELEILPENAIRALDYREKAEKTMYGYDVGEPLTNILSALPKKDRDRMKYFLRAPEEERDRILELAPNYLKRPLQSAWGLEVSEKPNLEEYFSKRQLPDQEWIGWDENVDLDSVKVKMINSEGLSNSEFNVWKEDVDKANSLGKIPLPNINYRSNATEIRQRLSGLLGDYGIRDSNITLNYGGSDLNIDLNVKHDSKDEIEEKLNSINF